MTHISYLFDMADFYEAVANGYVRIGEHPSADLYVLGYTEKAQFEKKWNDVTINCRGLIVDADMNIVARPWKKFFNYGEGRLRINDDQPVEVTDKMDGSLGILYMRVDGTTEIATRGSFVSEQAIHATRIWRERYEDTVNPCALMGTTFLFEIIYPANRIVLDYQGLDDLVLLGAVDNERGYYLGPLEAAATLGWSGPVTQVFPYKNLRDAFAAEARPNAEGFVVRSGTEMVKIKQVDYVELHRIVTNLNERTVWLQLGQGKTVLDICGQIPDEFHEFVKVTAAKLESQFSEIEDAVFKEFGDVVDSLPVEFTRREFAAAVSKSLNKAYLFNMLDEKPIDGAIWQSIRPSASKL